MGSTLGSLIRIGSNYIMNEFLKRHFNYMFFFPEAHTHQHGWLRKSYTPETWDRKRQLRKETKGQGEGLWEQKHEHLATETHPGYYLVSGLNKESQELRASLAQTEPQVRLASGSLRNKIYVQNLYLHHLWQFVSASSLPPCEHLPSHLNTVPVVHCQHTQIHAASSGPGSSRDMRDR